MKLIEIHNDPSLNDGKSKWNNQKLDKELQIIEFKDSVEGKLSLKINPKVVQYYFCIQGKLNFSFPESSYQITLKDKECFFFYNPDKALEPRLHCSENSQLLLIYCSLEKIHDLFLDKNQGIDFLKNENINRKFYRQDDLSIEMELAINQIQNSRMPDNLNKVFKYAKTLELLSLYFSNQSAQNVASCPFLNQESIGKIKEAKDLLIKNMAEPPTIAELASKVEINEFRLKEGFKSMYGTTIYNYLMDHKMNLAKSLLDSKEYKVQDVAYDLGYSNASHFISSFKNKFGVTPKKYLQNS